MYAVSDEYKQAMKSSVQRYKLKGTVGGVAFTDENILSGSLTITNQCSDNNSLELGKVYIGEFNATFLDMPIGKYGWADKEIVISFGLRLDDGTYEYVPLGVFNISEANWTESGVVVKAYDNMKKLDKSCGLEQSSGKAFSLARIACENCHVTLGNTAEEFAAFPNGKENLSMYAENDIDTWRDYLSWLSQTLGCFVTADRDGSIVFRRFKQDIVDTIDMEHRFTGCSFSDYETRYTGISVVNIAEATTSYYGMEVDDGLTMNLGSNPFLQYALEETLERTRRAVLEAVGVINYVPFKASMIGNPAYDLGDVFSFTEGIADSNRLFCMTKFVWRYNDTYEMQGVGENPALASAKSKTEKNLSGLIRNRDTSSMNYSTFMNSEVIDIADGAQEIIAVLRIAVVEKTHVDINAEILCEVTATQDPENPDPHKTATATVNYLIDGGLATRTPVETLGDGKHIIHLMYAMLAADAILHTVIIYITMNGGSMHINPTDVLIVSAGMGLAGTSEWDGTLDVYDEIGTMDVGADIWPFTDSAVTALVEVEDCGPTDGLPTIDIGQSISIARLQDALVSAFTGYRFLTDTEGVILDGPVTVNNGLWTGTGSVITPEIIVEPIVRIHGVSTGNTVVYSFAFNGQDTWVAYNGEAWTENYTNTDAQLMEIPKKAYEGVSSIRVKASITAGSLQSIIINTEGSEC